MFCQDPQSGLRAIIAIYSTALGPSLGGTRFYPYPSEDAALADALNLSRAMAYKNALAGLDLGGGKAVIIGDPRRDKSEALLRAYGRFVQSLGGRYITACDIGTYSEDMDIVARECRYVTGRTVPNSSAGDSSILTAAGVFGAARRGRARLGRPGPGRRTWSGWRAWARSATAWSSTCCEAGAKVVICDVNAEAAARAHGQHPAVGVAESRRALLAQPLDILRAVRHGRDPGRRQRRGADRADRLRRRRRPLAHPGIEKMLADRGILYAPDYVVNAGGVVQVADELAGFNFERAKERAAGNSPPPRRSSRWRTRRACRPRWRRTGWPGGEWPRWAGCAASGWARDRATRPSLRARKRSRRKTGTVVGGCWLECTSYPRRWRPRRLLRCAGSPQRFSAGSRSLTWAPHVEGVEPMGRGRAKANR